VGGVFFYFQKLFSSQIKFAFKQFIRYMIKIILRSENAGSSNSFNSLSSFSREEFIFNNKRNFRELHFTQEFVITVFGNIYRSEVNVGFLMENSHTNFTKVFLMVFIDHNSTMMLTSRITFITG